MFAHTDIKQAPWYVVNADDKKRARLNCIHHLLSQIPYEDLTPKPVRLPAAPHPQRLRAPADHRPDLRARLPRPRHEELTTDSTTHHF